MKKFVIFSLAVLFIAVFIPTITAEALKIEKGRKVKFDYTLVVDGQTIETSQGKQPLEYVDGEGQIIPGLAQGLEGLKAGDEKKIVVSPKDAYGEVNPQAVQEIPKTSFPKDFQAKQGMVIEVKDDKGNALPAVIGEVKKDTIVINFNHPLAGKTLEFNVKIVSVE